METIESSIFTQVIQDHLALKERNRTLERSMPLERYMTRDPFENHPLFKTEEQARIEETMDGEESAITTERQPLAWPTDETESETEGLWSRSRDFDWGD
jgi:hypothetical protein